MPHDTDPAIEKELEEFRSRYRKLIGRIPSGESASEWSTPNETIFTEGALRVRKFESGSCIHDPVLVVYSHVNSPHVIDLHPDHSLVRRLIENGHTVYLLDWGQVGELDRLNCLSVYTNDYIDAAVSCVCTDSGHDRVSLLGICQGGTFSLCYAALHPERVSRLVTVVTPVDFHAGDSILYRWVKYADFSPLEKSPVNVPGEVITSLFQMIRPFHDLKRQVEVIDQLTEQKKLLLTALMDQWVYHCPDQPGRAFARFIRLFFQQNALVQGSLEIGDTAIRLNQIESPVLNVYARHDHLVPPESSAALRGHLDPKLYRECVFEGGHIGLLVSEKAQQTILPEIGRWLAGTVDVDPGSVTPD